MNYKQDRLSYSSLKAFAKSPNHFIQYKTKPFDTASLAFGRAAHCYILEPDVFEKKFAVSPACDRRTKAGKEIWMEFTDQCGDRVALKPDEMALILAMQHEVSNSAAADLITGSKAEIWKEGYIDNQHFGGYADLWREGHFVADLKTCRDSSPEQFMRDAHNLDYHLQAAVYRKLFDVERFYWVAVESKAPHCVTVYQQSQKAAEAADMRLSMLIERWKKWDGKPASYFDGIQMLDLPAWAR